MTHDVPADWRAAGACASADPDLFFPVSARGMAAVQAERACRVCASCPVRRQCLEFAVEHRVMEGVWGGTTPEERARARRVTLAGGREGRPPGRAHRAA